VLGAAKADTCLNEKVGNGEDRDNDKPKQAVHSRLCLQEICQALAIGNYFSLDKGLLMGASSSPAYRRQALLAMTIYILYLYSSSSSS
jgi:hypothetical protein